MRVDTAAQRAPAGNALQTLGREPRGIACPGYRCVTADSVARASAYRFSSYWLNPSFSSASADLRDCGQRSPTVRNAVAAFS